MELVLCSTTLEFAYTSLYKKIREMGRYLLIGRDELSSLKSISQLKYLATKKWKAVARLLHPDVCQDGSFTGNYRGTYYRNITWEKAQRAYDYFMSLPDDRELGRLHKRYPMNIVDCLPWTMEPRHWGVDLGYGYQYDDSYALY